MLLYSMGSEHSGKELRCRKINGCVAKPNDIHIFELQVHVFNVQKSKLGLYAAIV